LEVIRRERETVLALLAKVKQRGTDGEEFYADELTFWNERLRGRANIVANVHQNLLEVKVTLAAFNRDVRQNAEQPPRIGEFLICLVVRPDRQEDRLADFAERFQTVWRPRFGTRFAGAVYIAHVLWSVADIVKITALAAVTDRIFRALGQ
jgi:hypothetical protein